MVGAFLISSVRTDSNGYAEVKDWDPKWDQEVTFMWWAEAYKGEEWAISGKRTLTYIPGEANKPPVPNFTFSPSHPNVGQSVTFDASTSFDPDGTIIEYRWDFPDMEERWAVTGHKVYHTFQYSLTYKVCLRVMDNEGLTGETCQLVPVEEQQEQASGRVMTSGGVGLPRVTITFSRVSGTGSVPGPATTDAQGNWSQAGFQAGTTYRATPSKTGYIFTSAYRDFSGRSAELNFTGKSAIEIVSYDASPRQIPLGQEVTFSMRVRNAGNTSVTFYCWVYLRQSDDPSPTFVLDPQVLTLGGGREKTVSWQVKTEGTALGYGGDWDVKFSAEIWIEETFEEYELASTG